MEKGIGVCSFLKNMAQNFGKNISKILVGKYNENLFDHAKQSARNALNTT